MLEFETEVAHLLTEISVLLKERNWRMVTAESCTGGWIAKCCTDVAGSSDWFDRAFVTYSYEAKEQMLGIAHQDLLEYSAVSEEIARLMAVGARQHSQAEVVVSVTGIAGPGGAQPGKPVGLVYFGWCIDDQPVVCDSEIFEGDRKSVRQQTVLHALKGIISHIGVQA